MGWWEVSTCVIKAGGGKKAKASSSRVWSRWSPQIILKTKKSRSINKSMLYKVIEVDFARIN